MDMYVARQPILNINRRLFGYELLYRGTAEYNLSNISGNRATTSLLSSTFLTEGIDIISGNKPCFINFTKDLLLDDIPLSFPKSKLIVEILEDVPPTKDVLAICRNLVKKGYRLALDDFIYDKSFDPLLELTEIVKIDVRLTPLDTIHRTLHRLSRFNVKLLAEKVESNAEYERANKLGFHFVQGFFFSKPEKILVKEIAASKVNLIHLMAEITKKETSLEKLKEIITRDIAISYKLLRFLNSAYFYLIQEVKTVQHAVAYLGEKELRRFILLAIISELALDKPGELIRLSLVRAKFCELLAAQSKFQRATDEIFLMGLFSLIDTMLETKMSTIMEKLPLSTQLKEALIYEKGPYANFLKAMVAYERKQFPYFNQLMMELEVKNTSPADSYIIAVKYANGLL